MADNNNGSGSGLDGLSERAYEIARRRQAAAREVVTMLEDQYETWFESSAASVLYACSWLAGTSLYRSLELAREVKPGSAEFSGKANEEGLKLLKVFMFLTDRDGIKLKPDDFALEIPADKRPGKSLPEVQQHFQQRYNEMMKAHEFDYMEGARTGAVACARLMRLHCVNRTDIEPPLAASIVSKGFIEAASTAPAPLDADNSTSER